MVAKDGRSTATNCQHLCKRKYLLVRKRGGERERGREGEINAQMHTNCTCTNIVTIYSSLLKLASS